MAKYRKLSKEEREICLRQKDRFADGLKFLEEESKIIEFKKDVMLPHSLKKSKLNFENEIKQLKEEISKVNRSIKILTEQLTKGVIEKKKEEKQND